MRDKERAVLKALADGPLKVDQLIDKVWPGRRSKIARVRARATLRVHVHNIRKQGVQVLNFYGGYALEQPMNTDIIPPQGAFNVGS